MYLKNEIVLALNVFLNSDGELPEEVKEVIIHAQFAAESSKYATVRVCYIVDRTQKEKIKTKISALGYEATLLLTLKNSQKLPMIGDILRSAKEICNDNSYICYINADIIIPYWFFDFVATSIRTHPRNTGFVINRKDILNEDFSFVEDDTHFPIRYHPGFDCFIFPQHILSSSHFGRCTIGLPPIGALLVTNMLVNLDDVKLINDSVITLHRGDGQKVSSWLEKQSEIDQNFRYAFEGMDKLVNHMRKNRITQIKTLTFSRMFVQKYMTSRGMTQKN